MKAEPFCQRALSILENSSSLDYPKLVDAVSLYALLLSKTNRTAQAELLETKAMVYAAKIKNQVKDGPQTASP